MGFREGQGKQCKATQQVSVGMYIQTGVYNQRFNQSATLVHIIPPPTHTHVHTHTHTPVKV